MRAGASNVECGSRGDCRPSASESSVRGRRSRDDRHEAHHRPATPPHSAERTANWIALRRNVPVNRGSKSFPGIHHPVSSYTRERLAFIAPRSLPNPNASQVNWRRLRHG